MNPQVKQWLKNIIKIRIMLDPNMMKLLPIIAATNPAMAKQMVVNTVRREGIRNLFQYFGPAGGLAFNQGGLLGFGTSGPLGLGILEGLGKDPKRVLALSKLAAAFPWLIPAGWALNQAQELIPGQKGGLKGTLGPRAANLASKLTEWGPRGGVQSHQEWITGGGGIGPLGGTFLPRATAWGSRLGIQGTPASRGTGIFGGKAGPWIADLLGFDPISKSKGSSGRGGNYQASTAGSGSTYWDPINQMHIDKSTGKEYVDVSTGYIPSPSLAQYTSGFTPGQGKK